MRAVVKQPRNPVFEGQRARFARDRGCLGDSCFDVFVDDCSIDDVAAGEAGTPVDHPIRVDAGNGDGVVEGVVVV